MADGNGSTIPILETSRQARMQTRHRMCQELLDQELAEGELQQIAPSAWYRDAAEEKRKVTAASLRGVLATVEEAFTQRIGLIVQNGAVSSPINESAPGQTSCIEYASLPGHKQRANQGPRTNFFVFVQGEIDEDLLGLFLETTPEAAANFASYRYAFVLAGDPKLKEITCQYRHEISAKEASTSRYLQYELADEDDKSSANDNTFTPMENETKGRSFYTTLRHCMRRAPPFFEASTEDIHSTWQELIKPHTDSLSMYSTHAYIILDERTANDWDTVQIVAETNGTTQRRRIDLKALREQLVLKGLDQLSFDITQLPTDNTGVIRGPLMLQATKTESAKKTNGTTTTTSEANEDQLEDVDAFFRAQKAKEQERGRSRGDDEPKKGIKRISTNMFKRTGTFKTEPTPINNNNYPPQPAMPVNMNNPLDILPQNTAKATPDAPKSAPRNLIVLDGPNGSRSGRGTSGSRSRESSANRSEKDLPTKPVKRTTTFFGMGKKDKGDKEREKGEEVKPGKLGRMFTRKFE